MATQWSHVALLDFGGQHNFTTLVPEMGESIFRAARAGYHPTEIAFGRELTTEGPLTHRVELKRHPKVKLSILTPDGKPAQKAKVEWSKTKCDGGGPTLRSMDPQVRADGRPKIIGLVILISVQRFTFTRPRAELVPPYHSHFPYRFLRTPINRMANSKSPPAEGSGTACAPPTSWPKLPDSTRKSANSTLPLQSMSPFM